MEMRLLPKHAVREMIAVTKLITVSKACATRTDAIFRRIVWAIRSFMAKAKPSTVLRK